MSGACPFRELNPDLLHTLKHIIEKNVKLQKKNKVTIYNVEKCCYDRKE